MDAVEYLNSIGFVTRYEQMMPIMDTFIEDICTGLSEDGRSSMPMLPAYLTVDEGLDRNHSVIVIDAGGTNLRVALVEVRPGCKPETRYFKQQPVPGKAVPLSRDDFFDALAAAVEPVADQSDRIGFCFSFPCRIREDLDGEILYMDKELSVDGISGALVGQGLLSALKKRGVKHDHRVVVLNDTVATLLGALAEHPADQYSGHIGMILGTGMNCCYSELNSRIGKNEYLKNRPGHSIINMEAGAFSRLFRTKADERLDMGTKRSGTHVLEKMVSGAYQGKVMHYLALCAAEDGLLGRETRERLSALPHEITSPDLSLFLMSPAKAGVIHDLAACEADARVIFTLADAVAERAALLAVMNLESVIRHTGTGKDPLKPVCIAVEGTTYARNDYWRHRIHAHLVEDVQKKQGIYFRIMSTEDANLTGSAMAAVLG